MIGAKQRPVSSWTRHAAKAVMLLAGCRCYCQMAQPPVDAPLPQAKFAVARGSWAVGVDRVSGDGGSHDQGDRTTAWASLESDRDGSTFVPMDSPVYAVLERLGALGLIASQNVGIRPWTRAECRRQMREAQEHLVDAGEPLQQAAGTMLGALEDWLREPDARREVVLESVYARGGTIAGPALTDGFHFGQTWRDDFGRPLGRGTSGVAGYSARMIAGRFFLYGRQEMQTVPTTEAVTAARVVLFNEIDNVHYGSPGPTFPMEPAQAGTVRQRPLDLYAGVAFAGTALSFGKQELFWGPTTEPLSFSANAEPTFNLRLVTTRPHPFPLVPRLGSFRYDLVFGKLSGHRYPARPYFNGAKVSFNFGPWLEMGFTRWSLLFGVGHPMTLGMLRANLFSSASTGTTFAYGDRTDPGDRKSGFDFRLRVPGTRGMVTIYTDGYADDEVNPIDAPRRVVWNPGLYVARLPGLPRADFRFEAASSEELSKDEGGLRSLINNQYRDGNTNRGFLLGNVVGRDGRSLEARTGYWLHGMTRVEVGARQTKISHVFLPSGGTISDVFTQARVAVGREWTVEGFMQYERFLLPAMMPGAQTNFSARLGVEWRPKHVLATALKDARASDSRPRHPNESSYAMPMPPVTP